MDELERIIYGKNPTQRIVSIEPRDGTLEVFLQNPDGSTDTHSTSNRYWILSNRKFDRTWIRLKGSLHYSYGKAFSCKSTYDSACKQLRRYDVFTVRSGKESIMLRDGFTYYKGMQPKEVSVLSFDIESSGLLSHSNKEVYLISNTYRNNDEVIKKLFSVDEYKDQYEMISSWCDWVREVDPSIMLGHNVFGYDLPYLYEVAGELNLGRDGSNITFDSYTAKYRVDGSQTWDYHNCDIYGREVIDTMFLSVKYDIGRNFPSWGLKPIVKYLGLEKDGRQHYDAGTIRDNWDNLAERKKIKDYAIDDADDALALFDHMIAPFFYMCQSIPKPFQKLINSASGSWLNSLFVRAYLQDKHSIPKADEVSPFEGAISYGIPGVYNNCFKQDVASLYPSIMRHWQVCDDRKDPNLLFPKVVDYFTIERLKNKQLYKETEDEQYDHLQAAQKILINSLYGFLGAGRVNFNSPKNAAFITEKGRNILNKAIKFATGEKIDYWKNVVEDPTFVKSHSGQYDLVNCDTDSILICKKDQSIWSEEDQQTFLDNLNKQFPELISWEDDGYYDSVIILKAKNYVLRDARTSKVKLKGSSITDSKKEPALSEMLRVCLDDLLNYKGRNILDIYKSYVKEALSISDISRWCVKKNITKAVLNPERPQEQKVLDALQGEEHQEGDKVFIFNDIDGQIPVLDKEGNKVTDKKGEVKMVDNRILRKIDEFTGSYDVNHYISRVYATISIIENVIDKSSIPKYHLKGKASKEQLQALIEEDNTYGENISGC